MSGENEYSHGVLGRWAVVGHGFNIASIISSVFVIASVVISCYRNPALRKRPTIRLSAWIALCDTIYSACQLCTFENEYMRTLSETNLRVIHWLMSASILSFVFMSVCVSIYILLSVVLYKSHITERIQPWFEYASMFCGFVITHPFLYLYKMVQWASTAQLFHIYEDPTYYKITSWLTMWAWLFAACAFMFIVIILTVSRMFSAFVETSKLSTFSEYAVDWDNNTAVSISSDRKKQIRSVIFRVMLYPTVPIITQVWVLAANMTLECPMWLYVVANIVPASQGIINFLIFITNPAWDSHRYQLYRRISSSGATKKASPNSSSTGFAKLDIEAGSCHSPRSAATLKF